MASVPGGAEKPLDSDMILAIVQGILEGPPVDQS
jgi:hypothetical protein